MTGYADDAQRSAVEMNGHLVEPEVPGTRPRTLGAFRMAQEIKSMNAHDTV